MPQFGAKLTDDSRVIIYNCNVFIIEATEEADNLSGLYYKNILTIVSDDRKCCLYYNCLISPNLSLS